MKPVSLKNAIGKQKAAEPTAAKSKEEPTQLSPREAYQRWAPRYESDPSPIAALERRFLVEKLPPLPGKLVVDVACGTGRWTAYLHAQQASVFGFDFSPAMLREAARKSGLKGRLVLADARRLPLATGAAEIVLFSLALGHITLLSAAIAEPARLVAQGGTLIITDFHPAAAEAGWRRTFRDGDAVHEIENHYYALDELARRIEQAGFDLVELAEPCFGEPERAVFRRAGKEHLFDEARGIPAVFIGVWRRR